MFLQGSVGAEFHHDVAVVPLLHNFVSFHHVRALYGVHSSLLALQQVLGDLVVDLAHLDGLDSHRLESFGVVA